MMATEGPLIAAVVARMAHSEVNLAAYGIATSVAMLIESPVIALLSTVVALGTNAAAVALLFKFMVRINIVVSAIMLTVCIPLVFELAASVMNLPADVAWRVYWGLVCMLAWPAAIGIRRYYQGLLIQAGKTKCVAIGTVIRLCSMASTAGILATLNVEGVIVGCCALTIGVLNEAIATWWLARTLDPADQSGMLPPLAELTNAHIIRFYAPLALTSVVSFIAAPLLSFFVLRLPLAVASLAVMPVISSFLFVFRSFGFSYQEVGIAMLGKHTSAYRMVERVARKITVATTLAMAVVVWTPLLEWIFLNVFALPESLVQMAIWPTRLLTVAPFTAATYSVARAVMISYRRTVHVTASMVIEVGTTTSVILVFVGLGNPNGVLSASLAITAGIVASVAYAVMVSKRIRREWQAP